VWCVGSDSFFTALGVLAVEFASDLLAMLIGCGVRRGELLALYSDAIQLREDHWVIADLMGKAGHIRTVPIPTGRRRVAPRMERSFARSTRPGLE
jgi:integrase